MKSNWIIFHSLHIINFDSLNLSCTLIRNYENHKQYFFVLRKILTLTEAFIFTKFKNFDNIIHGFGNFQVGIFRPFVV